MKLLSRTAALFVAAAACACTSTSVAEPLYTLKSAVTLPSTDTDWDYMKLEPGGSRLFIARREDGLTVYDIKTKSVVATVENSAGANGPLLLPQYNRGYAAMTDGSLLSFELDSLKVIERKQLATDGGLNAVVYDPATDRIQTMTGSRPEVSTWFSLDASTGKLIDQKVFPFPKMDDPFPDGKGHLFAPARYNNLLLTLDSETLAEQSRWEINCDQVVAVEYQEHNNRLFIGCRGEKPVFIVLDATTGRQISRLPIGKGIDGMAVDEQRHLIVTTNGGDASLSVIKQEGPDTYTLLGNVQTRPQARVVQLDPGTGDVYTVTADATFPASDSAGVEAEPIFHADTFTVLTYGPK